MPELGAVFVAEVRDDDDERALGIAAQHTLRGGDVVGVGGGRLHGVELAHQRVERLRALSRRERPLLAGRGSEGHGADRVALFQRHIRQQHHRVEHLIEVAGAGALTPIVGTHAAAAVHEDEHALVALVLELAHDRAVEPQRRPPVDVPHRVANPVFRQLLEVGALPAPLVALDADLLQAAIAGQPRVAGDLRKIGIDAPRLAGPDPLEQLDQPPA